MNPSWYYNRLKSMRPDEVLYRLKKLLWQVSAGILRKRWARSYRNSVSCSTRIINMMERINFYGLNELQRSDIPGQWRANTISTAEKLLEHRYQCFNVKDVYLGKEINFNHEIKRDIDTPLEFAPWMDYRDTKRYGHFKYFWELGRFQHLITLAKAYYLTGHEKYAREVAGQIKTFVSQCPYLLGVHWIMPMETGLRLISIAWITAFMKEYLRNDAETCNLIEQIVISHTDYTAKSFSAFSSANNHLIGELAGIFVAGLCFEGLDGMAGYKQKAYDMLRREITLQFHTDGVNREQTTHYHISCYNCFLLAGLLGRANGMDFPSGYWKTLEQGADFIRAMTEDGNIVPSIGDSDDGKTIVLSETEPNQVQSLLATAAAIFKRGDFKVKAGHFDEMSFWLLGKTGKAGFDALPIVTKDAGSEKFEEGGYYILRGNGPADPKIVFDCGPIGMGPIAAHGHADSLSFLLYAYKREFFIDPGTYIFEAGNPYRNYFRSTAAHNTITIDGRNQSEMRGPFLWGDKARSFVDEWVDNEEFASVTAWHNGYSVLDDPVIHRRTIELNKKRGIVKINDSIEAKAEHEICQYFHLAPECETTATEGNNWKITSGDKSIVLVTDKMFNCELVRGGEAPICGWASRSYDSKVPINTLVCRMSSKGNQLFSTMIML